LAEPDGYDEDSLFESLVENGFEFLNKALDEFEDSAKFSTVHFSTAIELFLKSRLMKEHWSLLVERIDSAKRDEFFLGKLKTVNLDTSIKRLKDIACDPISEEAKKIFSNIAQHRNRMVHFVHGHTPNKEQAQPELEEVVAEQCKGWRQLQLLLVKNWAEYFSEYSESIDAIEWKMQKHRGYLKAKFASKAQEIKEHKTAGNNVRTCPSCGFDSVLVTPEAGAISTTNCVVCWYSGSVVSVDCPEHKCHQVIEFDSFEGPPEHCPSCGATIQEWIAEGLDTGDPIGPDNYFDHIEKNCPYCGGYHTVVEHHDGYVCTECFEYSEALGVCGWCHEGQLGGVSEISYVTGCEFCDGRVGWEKD